MRLEQNLLHNRRSADDGKKLYPDAQGRNVPGISQDDIVVLDLVTSCLLYDLVGDDYPLAYIGIYFSTKRILGL